MTIINDHHDDSDTSGGGSIIGIWLIFLAHIETGLILAWEQPTCWLPQVIHWRPSPCALGCLPQLQRPLWIWLATIKWRSSSQVRIWSRECLNPSAIFWCICWYSLSQSARCASCAYLFNAGQFTLLPKLTCWPSPVWPWFKSSYIARPVSQQWI